MPALIHCSHCSRIRDLNARFTEMSNGCSFLVSPPGITAVVVLCFFFKSSRTPWSMWPEKLSKINSDVRSKIETGLFCHTFSAQTLSPWRPCHLRSAVQSFVFSQSLGNSSFFLPSRLAAFDKQWFLCELTAYFVAWTDDTNLDPQQNWQDSFALPGFLPLVKSWRW